MYLDAILAKDNITHIVNDNVMKIYYAYKHCYSQLSNELAKNYPEQLGSTKLAAGFSVWEFDGS